jgi:hypothetical protein
MGADEAVENAREIIDVLDDDAVRRKNLEYAAAVREGDWQRTLRTSFQRGEPEGFLLARQEQDVGIRNRGSNICADAVELDSSAVPDGGGEATKRYFQWAAAEDVEQDGISSSRQSNGFDRSFDPLELDKSADKYGMQDCAWTSLLSADVAVDGRAVVDHDD